MIAFSSVGTLRRRRGSSFPAPFSWSLLDVSRHKLAFKRLQSGRAAKRSKQRSVRRGGEGHSVGALQLGASGGLRTGSATRAGALHAVLPSSRGAGRNGAGARNAPDAGGCAKSGTRLGSFQNAVAVAENDWELFAFGRSGADAAGSRFGSAHGSHG